ncbi:Cytochrome P450 E-class group I protein [Dioscorea alata]|uniref:Cytochrome P450 E-class group I protein n=1 Tax=Dioscorea alata TaxID=55571 RepID=A0ACB7UKB4_DIOAL|nr:Cytochrome P450 E-class group I protein [Dioscorea alata]
MADKLGPAFILRLGSRRTLVISGWELAKECFTINDKALATRPTNAASKHMGYDSAMFGFAPYGSYWRSIRKIATTELLSNARLDMLKHVMLAEIDTCIKELHKLCDNNNNNRVDMKKWFGDLNFNIVLQMVAGKRFFGSGGVSDEAWRFRKAVNQFFQLLFASVPSDMFPCLEWMDLGGYRSTRREELQGLPTGHTDFMDVMLSIMEDDDHDLQHYFDKETLIKATSLALILGGTDTTTVSLTRILGNLLNNQEMMKKVQTELDEQVGKDRVVNESDMKKLVYFRAVIKEAFRLTPSAELLVPRETMEDCIVAGFQVPAGTQVIVNAWKLHRDPGVWSDPFEFRPERFLSSHAATGIDVKGQNYELIPFGTGRRSCPGISMALHVIHLALARLIQAFELRALDSDSDSCTAHIGYIWLQTQMHHMDHHLFEFQSIVAVIFTFIILYKLWCNTTSKRSNTKQKKPPQPFFALPVIGHLHLFLNGQPFCRTVADMVDKLGPAFMLQLGSQRTLVISSWDVAKECFTINDKAFSSRPITTATKYICYNGAMIGFAPYGSYWRSIRKIATTELLSNTRLDKLKHVMLAEIDTCIKDLHTLCDNNNNRVDMKKWFGDLNFNIVLQMVVGKRFFSSGGGSDEAWKFRNAAHEFFHLILVSVPSDMFPWLEWMDLGGYVKAMKAAAKEMDCVMVKLLEEHRERRRRTVSGVPSGQPDFMDVMLSIMEDGFQFESQLDSDTVIKANSLALILGGTDTTSTSLTKVLGYLLKNQDALKKVQSELDEQVGKDRVVNESDIKNLIYLQAVIKESSRLSPASEFLIPRETTENCTVAGFQIPAGTKVMMHAWKLHRDPLVWGPDPLEFRPERVLLGTRLPIDHMVVGGQKGHNFELVPFGAGRRACPGISMALHVMHLTLARLIQDFEFRVVGDVPDELFEGLLSSASFKARLMVDITPRRCSL